MCDSVPCTMTYWKFWPVEAVADTPYRCVPLYFLVTDPEGWECLSRAEHSEAGTEEPKYELETETGEDLELLFPLPLSSFSQAPFLLIERPVWNQGFPLGRTCNNSIDQHLVQSLDIRYQNAVTSLPYLILFLIVFKLL